MSTDEFIETRLKRLRSETTAELDAKILAETKSALQQDDASAIDDGKQAIGEGLEPKMSRMRHNRFAAIASSLSVIVVISVVFAVFFTRSELTWAQVAEAVKLQPWMRMKTIHNGTDVEMWISFEREVDAGRQGENAHFTDHRSGISERFDAAEKKISRSADLSGKDRTTFRSFSSLFVDLIKGTEKLSLPGSKIVRETRTTVTENGTTWIDVELLVDEGVVKTGEHARLIFRVDPATKLPVKMTSIEAGSGAEQIEFAIDYPKTGPKDIYALGVSRDMTVVDQVPNQDVMRVLESLKKAREQFDDYSALEVWQTGTDPWYRGTPMRIWYQHEPKRRRLDYGFEYPDFKLSVVPDETINQRAWWLGHSKKFWYVPAEVQNGDTAFFNNAVAEDADRRTPPFRYDATKWPKPKWTSSSRASLDTEVTLPVEFGYPDSLLSARGPNTPKLQPAAADKSGLPSVEVKSDAPKLQITTAGTVGTLIIETTSQRYTIDPKRGNMVVRTDWDVSPEKSDKPTVWSMIVEEAAQSPKGFWYPTRIRSIEQRDGKPTRDDSILQFYLNFDAKIPESVFKPVDHVITNDDELK